MSRVTLERAAFDQDLLTTILDWNELSPSGAKV